MTRSTASDIGTTSTVTELPEGWVEMILNEALELIIDHRGKTPKKLGGDWSNSGYRAISAKTIKNGALVNEEQMNILPKNLYQKWMKEEVQRGDIFLTSEAPLGEHMIWKSNEKLVLSQRIFGIRTDKNKLDPYFLNYFIDSPYYQHELKSRESGSTVTGIKQSELIKTKILLPPLRTQKRIAAVLSCLDDKIELLREQNKTLEATAQTLFKEWFGRYSVDRPEELPRGWRVGQYSDITRLSSGKGVKKSDYVENGKYEIFGANGSIGRYNDCLVDEPIIATGRVGTLGSVFILNDPIWISDNVLISKPIESYFFYYTYLILQSFNFLSLNSGSTQPLITQTDLKSVAIIIPDKNMLEKFDIIAHSLFLKIHFNTTQIQSLSKLRDTLLPKLMRGEIIT